MHSITLIDLGHCQKRYFAKDLVPEIKEPLTPRSMSLAQKVLQKIAKVAKTAEKYEEQNRYPMYLLCGFCDLLF